MRSSPRWCRSRAARTRTRTRRSAKSIAWIIGWDLILEYGLSLAPTASSLSDYFQHMLANVGIVFPAWAQTANLGGGHVQVDVFAGLTTLAVAVLVAVGIRESAGVNGALVVVQIVAMLVFIAAVAHAINPANLHPVAPFGYHGVIASTALVFFAYIGFDTVTVASEEATRPERDIPIGIILALTLGGILYVALTLCTVGVLRFDRLSDGAAMLDALGSVSKSHTLYWIVAIGGLAGNATVMLTSLLGQVRIFYVMARDRMLPPGVARIHSVFRTPARMTLVTGAIVAIFAAVLPLTALLKLVNIGTLVAFAIVCAGVLGAARRQSEREAAVPRAALAALLDRRRRIVPVSRDRSGADDVQAIRDLVRDRDRRLRALRLSQIAPCGTRAPGPQRRVSGGPRGNSAGVTIGSAVSDRFELITVPASRGVPSFADDVVRGLGSQPKRLPSKYFYDDVGSALFDAITRSAGILSHPRRDRDSLASGDGRSCVCSTRR